MYLKRNYYKDFQCILIMFLDCVFPPVGDPQASQYCQRAQLFIPWFSLLNTSCFLLDIFLLLPTLTSLFLQLAGQNLYSSTCC